MPYEETTMSDQAKIYPVPEEFAAKANLTPEKYKEMYDASLADPEAFWGEQGKRLDWIKPFCLIAHGCFLVGHEFSDDPNESHKVTYKELHAAVCRFANVLKKRTG